MAWLDSISLPFILILCLTLGLAPFVPEPHLFEKVRMLFQGTLSKPVDIFDMLMHGAPWLVLVAKLVRMALVRAA